MNTPLEKVLPNEIEKRSFEIISQEMPDVALLPEVLPVVKRVIHTTADFDYAYNLRFSPNAIPLALQAILQGAPIVTDTQMAKAGINKQALKNFGMQTHCFMADDDVAQAARQNGTTRAKASMDKAASLGLNGIFAVGNAPTALVRLFELIEEGRLCPKLVIGVPVGFVNVVESKELIMQANVPYIVAKGRKGGSNVAAAICNALLYMAQGRTL